MNPDEFKTNPGGRVIRVGQDETAYWTFVPNPLPPNLTFDSTLIRLLSDADRALGEVVNISSTSKRSSACPRTRVDRKLGSCCAFF